MGGCFFNVISAVLLANPAESMGVGKQFHALSQVILLKLIIGAVYCRLLPFGAVWCRLVPESCFVKSTIEDRCDDS